MYVRRMNRGDALRRPYRVHASKKCVVLRCVILGLDKYAIPLSGRQIDHIRVCRFGVDPVDLNDLHGVALDPKVLTGKSSYVNDTEHISFPRLDHRCQILRVVHERRLRNRLSPCRVGHADEGLQQVRHLVVIPIREREISFLMIVILIRRFWIADNERPSEPIRILSSHMGVVPVCAGLIDLLISAGYVDIDKSGTHREVIRELFTGRNATLGHSDYSIHMSCAIHVETMKMKTCGLVA